MKRTPRKDVKHEDKKRSQKQKWEVVVLNSAKNEGRKILNRNTKSEMSATEKALLDRILKMRPTQQRRIFTLVDLYRKATTEQEANEVGEVLAEILFGEPKDYTGSKVENDGSAEGREALEKHRKYVGGRIRKFRRSLHMSQEELAKKAGIPQSHVCRLETGKHAPSYLTIEKISAALCVKKSQLDPGFDD